MRCRRTIHVNRGAWAIRGQVTRESGSAPLDLEDGAVGGALQRHGETFFRQLPAGERVQKPALGGQLHGVFTGGSEVRHEYAPGRLPRVFAEHGHDAAGAGVGVDAHESVPGAEGGFAKPT